MILQTSWIYQTAGSLAGRQLDSCSHPTVSFSHDTDLDAFAPTQDRHLSDRQNRTPLMLAAAVEHRDIVRVLGDEAVDGGRWGRL